MDLNEEVSMNTFRLWIISGLSILMGNAFSVDFSDWNPEYSVMKEIKQKENKLAIKHLVDKFRDKSFKWGRKAHKDEEVSRCARLIKGSNEEMSDEDFQRIKGVVAEAMNAAEQIINPHTRIDLKSFSPWVIKWMILYHVQHDLKKAQQQICSIDKNSKYCAKYTSKVNQFDEIDGFLHSPLLKWYDKHK